MLATTRNWFWNIKGPLLYSGPDLDSLGYLDLIRSRRLSSFSPDYNLEGIAPRKSRIAMQGKAIINSSVFSHLEKPIGHLNAAWKSCEEYVEMYADVYGVPLPPIVILWFCHLGQDSFSAIDSSTLLRLPQNIASKEGGIIGLYKIMHNID